MQRTLGTPTLLESEQGKLAAGFNRRHLFSVAVLFGVAGLLRIPVAASEAENAARPMGVDEFVALSRVLTGAKGLSRELAELYLRHLVAEPGGNEGLAALWNAAGLGLGRPPQDLRALVEAGVFLDKDFDNTARAVLKLWYTGSYESAGVPQFAEYTDTLAWRAVGYAAAPSNCGGSMGFWADPPREAHSQDD